MGRTSEENELRSVGQTGELVQEGRANAADTWYSLALAGADMYHRRLTNDTEVDRRSHFQLIQRVYHCARDQREFNARTEGEEPNQKDRGVAGLA